MLILARKTVTLFFSFKTSSYLQASILLSGFFARQKFRQFCSSCRVMNMGKKSELASLLPVKYLRGGREVVDKAAASEQCRVRT